MGADVDAG